MYLKNIIIIFLSVLFYSCNSKFESDLKIEKRDDSFDELFSILKENFIDKDSIDWLKFEEAVLLKNKISKDSAIIEALTLLGNRHTSYIKANGVHLRGKFNKSINKVEENCFNLTNNNLFKSLKNISYIKIDRIDNKSQMSEREYIFQNLSLISSKINSDYWIIDLRGNTGGAIWPMLISLLPFYQDGIIGHNVFKKNNFSTAWVKKEGSIFLGDQNQSEHYLNDKIYFTVNPKKVFVLIDQKTMSAAEAVVISLKSLSNVEFIGSRTGGYTTNNVDVSLKNLDKLRLTVNYMADNQKKVYKRGIMPNQKLCNESDILNYIEDQIN